MNEEATVTSKGQVTIPKKVRERLGLDAGSKVTFILRDGESIMLPKPEEPLEELRELRSEISFDEEEIAEMVRESKRAWGKHE